MVKVFKRKVVQAMEPFVAEAAAPGDVLVLYSRRSEDLWQLRDRKAPGAKRGFVAHRNVLYFLLRRGYPFRVTFLESPDPDRLKEARVVLVPFPAALTAAEAGLLETLARGGKTVVIMSGLSALDELGRARAPRLAGLFGGRTPEPGQAKPIENQVGEGRAVFLGDDFAVRLLEAAEPVKDPKVRVPVLPFATERCALLDSVLTAALGRPGSVLAAQPDLDVEATVVDGPRGRLLLAINWDTAVAADVQLRAEALRQRTAASGFRINAAAEVKEEELRFAASGKPWALHLEPQDAVLVRLQ